MDGTSTVVMGDRGRLVVPAELRDRLDLRPGTRLVLFEEDGHLVLMSHAQLLAGVQREFADGPNLVDELIAERRAAAAVEDAETVTTA